MKIRTYVLTVFAGMLMVTAGTDKAGLIVGNRPGDIAPRIKSLGGDGDITFSNSSGRYTLLHFWAAYDAESRMQNVQLWNKLNQGSFSSVKMISVSLDEPESIFKETVKIDNLEKTNQVHEGLGKHSEVFKLYGLKRKLTNFLIDDKGVIVATDVNPDKLNELIKKKS